jgi:hypothetical protein
MAVEKYNFPSCQMRKPELCRGISSRHRATATIITITDSARLCLCIPRRRVKITLFRSAHARARVNSNLNYIITSVRSTVRSTANAPVSLESLVSYVTLIDARRLL